MELVVPVSESSRGVFLDVLGEGLELVELDKSLDGIPSSERQPIQGVLDSGFRDALDQEVHLQWVVGDVDDLLLHEPEGDEGQEDNLVLLEQSSGHPLINDVPDVIDQLLDPGLIILGGSLDGFVEEEVEGLEGILIHVVHDVQ